MGLIIDLKRIKQNVVRLKTKTKSDFCAVVKADAYGHGIVEVSKYIKDQVDFFAVASKDEALKICGCVDGKSVLVLSGDYDYGAYPENVIFSAVDTQSFTKLSKSGRKFAVKINTGMNRLGIKSKQATPILDSIDKRKIHSVYSHIFSPSKADSQLRELLPYNSSFYCHLCASNFLSLSECYHLSAVRCGIAMYGYGADWLKPAMSVNAKIISVFEVDKGDYVGYGSYKAKKKIKLATIGIGYGDGFSRKLSSTANKSVLVSDILCRVVGQICMDTCMVDVTSVKNVKSGDYAWILCDKLDANRIANQASTINYEILTQLSHARGEVIYIK